jgi:hypothetical protein
MRDISLNTLPSEKQLFQAEMIQWEQYMPCGKPSILQILTWQTDNILVALSGDICGIREIILQFYMSAFSLLTGKYFGLKFFFNAIVNGVLS